jgi:hypothetical protein
MDSITCDDQCTMSGRRVCECARVCVMRWGLEYKWSLEEVEEVVGEDEPVSRDAPRRRGECVSVTHASTQERAKEM